MIKNPKLGQTVFFVDDRGTILKGKLSQVYCSSLNGAVGVDNFYHIDKSFIFSTKKRAEEYYKLTQNLKSLNEQIKNTTKKREKLASRLAEILGEESANVKLPKLPKTWGFVSGQKF